MKKYLSLGFLLWAVLILLPAAPVRADVLTWYEDPWTFTDGGTLKPSKSALTVPWSMRMLRNGTEQAIIGLMNTGRSTMDVKVSVSSTLPPETSSVDLLVLGGIKSRSHGNPLVNMFTEAQVKSFNDKFPDTFTNTDQIRDFPTLHLPSKVPVRLWLRVRTFHSVDSTNYPPAGSYQIHFVADWTTDKIAKDVDLTVLSPAMPTTPLIETITWGGIDDTDNKLHHTTVTYGYLHYYFHNMVSLTGMWGKNVAEIAQNDPDTFKKNLQHGLDWYLRNATTAGVKHDQVLTEIYDEPNDNPGMIANWLTVAKALRQTDPTLKIIANPPANSPGLKVTIDGTFKPLAPYVDVWMPFVAHYYDADTYAFLKSTGKPLWMYCNCGLQEARDESALTGGYIRIAGWTAAKFKLDGMGFWTVANYYGDPWNDFDHDPKGPDYPDAAVVFRSTAGPIDTRGWEAWRTAVEDVTIYRMVEHALAKGWVADDSKQKAQNWLNTTPDQVVQSYTTDKNTDPKLLRQALDGGLDILANLTQPYQ